MKQLPPGARVLDLGCGTANPIGALLVGRGFALHGVDRSVRLLTEARQNLPGSTFELRDIEDYRIDRSYAGIALWDMIFHLPRADHEPLLRRIFNTSRPVACW